ncbi:MAG: CotH kinase family protein [Planctomycetes bacterium]|nr:CotH kinase family protein [Planctomycetota bacterium]
MNGTCRLLSLALCSALASVATAQDPPDRGGRGMGPGGPGGPGGPMGQNLEVVERFDRDGNHRLDAAERKAARAWIVENRPQRPGPGGPGPGGFGPGGFGPGGPPPDVDEPARDDATPKNGRRVALGDVAKFADRPLFDPDCVRTFFLDFPDADWFDELTAFYRTDVAIPAKVTVDGRVYEDVGLGFRGNTSYQMARGRKKSFDLAFDFVHEDQNLLGFRNLDLLNSHEDPSFLREAIHGEIANRFFPAPRVALVRLVVNGEDFGIYAAVQQFDKDFLRDHFGTTKGDRFKVPPDFSGGGGLRWLGEDPGTYRRSYQLKSGSGEKADKAWAGLVDLCSVLERTPAEDLERILPQHLDVDASLWFLAMDNAFADDDGYESRASDYLLYRDPHGRFHPIPRDNNEVLLGQRSRPGGGPGGGPGPVPGRDRRDGPDGPPRGPGGRRPGGGPGSTAATPLEMANRADRPLMRRLLEVPAWRQRYLANLRVLAKDVFTAQDLGARIDRRRAAIDDLVKHDAHALYGYAAFVQAFAKSDDGAPAPRSLMAVVAQRRKAILDDAAMQGPWPETGELTARVQTNTDGTRTIAVACRVGGAELAAVRLHVGRDTFGAFTPETMFDDGRHGDGAANDGVFGATIPAVDAATTVRVWVEAEAAGSHHVACSPAGGGALPRAFAGEEPKKDEKKG